MKRDNSEKNYRSRMARVVAAIVADPMAQHSLEDLAAIAHFSPFHFHRLYRSLMGETTTDTVRRMRLAQAAALLGENRRSVTQIALDAGYDSPQAFTRAFRQYAGASPRAFQRKIHRIADPRSSAPAQDDPLCPQVQLIELGSLQVQALQHHGPLGTIPHTHRHLRQLVADRPTAQWLGISYGDAEVEGDFAYYAAATLADGDRLGEETVPLTLPAGSYAMHTLTGPYTQINAAIAALYTLWLPFSGYEPDDRPLLEIYRNSPRTTAPDALHTDLLIPVRPLQN